MLTLSWSDGNTLIPVNSCLVASANETNVVGPVNTFDKRTLDGKRRKLAQAKAPEVMLTLLDTATASGLAADYVLFDCWFANSAQITAIVFVRYMLLTLEQRQNEDQRTLGEIFFFLVNEMSDITFSRSLFILMNAMMTSLQEILKLSDEQLTAFTTDFEVRFPKYLQDALHPQSTAA